MTPTWRNLHTGPLTALTLVLSATATHAQSPTLPGGSYTLFAGNGASANFIVENSISRTGERVRLAIYRVYAEGAATSRGIRDQEVIAGEIDCGTRTWRMLSADAFTATGQWIASFPAEAETPIRPEQTWDFAAKIVCGEVRMPSSATVSGAVAARALGRSRLGL
ncbi:hypothetical protein KOAAANKH_03389 [Brevundimonas sp. NIBR10]|uniref:surface-adhesin E family protein n=1 Tax=Brevundimonas sp. NIBR10 TaxID=3015997 RepID=UPI0022F145F5|nr:surface-adhesin E family protein [Brevundimonas sp. NIBR10]WGM48488.1 hypothetical protein KOAAANKH_03389 [Brevundimonas sp. NIBR10]